MSCLAASGSLVGSLSGGGGALAKHIAAVLRRNRCCTGGTDDSGAPGASHQGAAGLPLAGLGHHHQQQQTLHPSQQQQRHQQHQPPHHRGYSTTTAAAPDCAVAADTHRGTLAYEEVYVDHRSLTAVDPPPHADQVRFDHWAGRAGALARLCSSWFAN
jgi:hypothetical protein